MKRRTRIIYTDAQKALMWNRWQQGDSMHDIGRLFDRFHASVRRILTENGGIRPRERKRSPSTISRETHRNDGHTTYRASKAESAAWERGLRPKVCKLAARPKLAREVTIKLQLEWSPEQIAGWLKTRFPDDERYHASYETIYKGLFVQACGALKKELLAHLRTQRTTRRPRRTTLKGKGLGSIADAASISERPASLED
ncbi:MAG: IS30 family transposase [Congregibacter sp.]|jgi:IS30 family transposase